MSFADDWLQLEDFPTTRDAEREARLTWADGAPAWAATRIVAGAVRVVSDEQPWQLPQARYFEFPGRAGLERLERTTLGWVLEHTAIEAVQKLGGGLPPDEAEFVPQGFVRPVALDGVLTLHVRPFGDGEWVPFEQPQPTPCCAAHA